MIPITDSISRFKLKYLSHLNLGIILISIYYVFEFGSIQGLYTIITKLRAPYLLAAFTSIYCLILLLRKKGDLSTKVSKLYVLFCLFTIIYSFFATIQYVDRLNTIKLFWLYLCYYLISTASVRTFIQFILIIDIWLASVAYSSFHGFFQGGLVWGNQWIADQNQYAVLLIIAFPFLFFLWLECKEKLKKIVYFVCIILNIAGIVLAASRGGIIAAFIVGILCFIFSKTKKIVLVVFILISIGLALLAPHKFYSEIEKIDPKTRDSSITSRIDLWGFAWEMFKDNPIIGVGPINFTEYLHVYDSKGKYGKINWKGTANVAHSTPLTFLAETGILGFSLIVLIQAALIGNWKVIHRYIKQEDSVILNKKERSIFSSINNACLISQVGFWIGSMFITLNTFPFLYVIIVFSECLKNVFIKEIKVSIH